MSLGVNYENTCDWWLWKHGLEECLETKAVIMP